MKNLQGGVILVLSGKLGGDECFLREISAKNGPSRAHNRNGKEAPNAKHFHLYFDRLACMGGDPL